MDKTSEPYEWERKLPRYWLPDTQGYLFLIFLGFLILHVGLAAVPYISEEWFGLHMVWADKGIMGGLVGFLLPVMLLPAIAAAACYRKLCYVMKDRYSVLMLALASMVMTVGFTKVAKEAIEHTVGGAEIWYGMWGLAAIYILKPGMDHILDMAQPKL